MSEKPKYAKCLVDDCCGHGKEWWIIYEADGNYIDNRVAKLPGGSRYLRREAQTVLESMNGQVT